MSRQLLLDRWSACKTDKIVMVHFHRLRCKREELGISRWHPKMGWKCNITKNMKMRRVPEGSTQVPLGQAYKVSFH
jgi:hypothetical protein